MELQTEKLEESILSKIKELNNRKNELTINAGQLHLDIAELNKIISIVETEYGETNKELNSILSDLNTKYPNGEIDLIEGKIIYQK
jgi:hypothetical protein